MFTTLPKDQLEDYQNITYGKYGYNVVSTLEEAFVFDSDVFKVSLKQRLESTTKQEYISKVHEEIELQNKLFNTLLEFITSPSEDDIPSLTKLTYVPNIDVENIQEIYNIDIDLIKEILLELHIEYQPSLLNLLLSFKTHINNKLTELSSLLK